MKKMFTLLFILAGTIGSSAQSFLKSMEVQTTSTEILGQEVEQSGYLSVLFANPTDDGGLMVFNSVEPPNSHARTLSIQKISESGEAEWTKAYSNLFVLTHEPRPDVAIQATEDGGYIGVFGEGLFSDFQLVRFDDKGEIIWSKLVRTQESNNWSYSQAFGVTELANGDIFYITGQPYNSFFVFARLDGMTGELLSEKRVSISSAISITDIVATQDGGALILGRLEQGGHTNFDLFVLKWGADDDREWIRRIGEVQNLTAIAAFEYDNNYVIFSRINEAILAFKLDPETGDQLQARGFLLEVGGREHEPILPLNRFGDQIFFSGVGFDPFSADITALLWQFDMKTFNFDWMLKNTKSGNGYFLQERFARYQDGGLFTIRGEGSLFMQQYKMENGLPTSCEGATYEQVGMTTIDGAAAFGFWPVNVSNTDWLILSNRSVSHQSFNSVEQMICEEVAQEEEIEEEETEEPAELEPLELVKEVTIAPNPTIDLVRIAMPGYEELEVELNLFDASGRWISKRVEVVAGLIEYDLSTLAAGAYYLRFQTDTDTFTKRIVKITP